MSTAGPPNLETLVALLEQRQTTAEKRDEAMLHALEGLRSDLNQFVRETVSTYTPRAHCDTMCLRSNQQLQQLGRDVRDELQGIRDGQDERLRELEATTSGFKGALPLVVAMLSLLASLAMAGVNFALRAGH